MGDQIPKDEDLRTSETIPPPKDLPDFVKQDKLSSTIQPLPPQLHLFPQPKIVVAPPTPCPLSSPTGPIESRFPLPGNLSFQTPGSASGAAAVELSASSSDVTESMNMRFPTDLASAPTLESKKRSQKTEAMEEVGVLGWLQKRVNNSAFLSKVADKAKTSMDSVLTTLDPGMKDFLKKEGSVNIVIASENVRIVTAIADGFRKIFATVNQQSIAIPSSRNTYPQIIGYSAALKCIKERITLLRAGGSVPAKSAVIVFQPFLHEIEGDWYESAVIGAQKNTSITHVFSQPIQVDATVMKTLQKHTPDGYDNNGYAISVGTAYAEVYGIDSDDWQLARWSVSSSESYRLASTVLAHSFKEKYSIP